MKETKTKIVGGGGGKSGGAESEAAGGGKDESQALNRQQVTEYFMRDAQIKLVGDEQRLLYNLGGKSTARIAYRLGGILLALHEIWGGLDG